MELRWGPESLGDEKERSSPSAGPFHQEESPGPGSSDQIAYDTTAL